MLHVFCNLKKKTKFLATLGIVTLVVICLRIYQLQYPAIDDWFLTFLGERNNNYLNFIFKVSYEMGGTYVAGGIVIVALGVMIWQNYRQEAQAFAVATLGILILVDRILKPFFDRNRPPKPRLVDGLSRHSFPSGHAAGNLVLYFYLSFVIATKYPKLKVYVYGLATAIAIAIGFGSVYTKAHWLTDVLAGYIFGYLWLMVSLGLLKFLQRRSITKDEL